MQGGAADPVLDPVRLHEWRKENNLTGKKYCQRSPSISHVRVDSDVEATALTQEEEDGEDLARRSLLLPEERKLLLLFGIEVRSLFASHLFNLSVISNFHPPFFDDRMCSTKDLKDFKSSFFT